MKRGEIKAELTALNIEIPYDLITSDLEKMLEAARSTPCTRPKKSRGSNASTTSSSSPSGK